MFDRSGVRVAWFGEPARLAMVALLLSGVASASHAAAVAFTDQPSFLAAAPAPATLIAFNGLPVAADAVQDVTVTGAAGAYVLTFNGQTTPALAFNATAAQVQAALNALSSIGGAGGSVAVTGGAGSLSVTFGGALADTNVGAITGSGFGGASVNTSNVTAGQPGTAFPNGTGLDGVRFLYNSGGGNLSVVGAPGAPAGVNALQGFGPGGSLTIAFSNPVNAAGVYVLASGAVAPGGISLTSGQPHNEIQRVAVTGAGGTFTLTFGGQTTAALASNASAAQVQAALNALSSIGGVGGSVTVTASAGDFDVNFAGTFAGTNVAALTSAGSGGATTIVSTLISATSGGSAFTANSGAAATVLNQNETQSVKIGGGSGAFTLSFNGQTTAPLAFNATAAQIQAALNALASIGGAGGNVSVTGGAGAFDVTFAGTLAGEAQNLLVATGSGGATVNVGEVAQGEPDLTGFVYYVGIVSTNTFTSVDLAFNGATSFLLDDIAYAAGSPTIPEPPAVALLALCCCGLLLGRGRRRQGVAT